MTDTRPTEWQWRTPANGRIDGLTREEWQQRGVKGWMSRYASNTPVLVGARADFCTSHDYAPATEGWLPAAWPAKMAWQWRKLDADMAARTWRAAVQWRYGGYNDNPQMTSSRYEGSGNTVADRGEWWAPADQDGNPCAWPAVETVNETTAGDDACPKCGYEPWMDGEPTPCQGSPDPQPLVVISAAEMSALVLHGHRALDGTWRWRYRGGDWSENDGGAELWCNEEDDEVDVVEWAPCDEHGDFCELRQLVPEAVSGQHDWRGVARKMQNERDEAMGQVALWSGRAQRMRNDLLELAAAIHNRADKAWDGDDQ